MSCFVRVRHPNGEELTIDLIELEEALEGGSPGHYYLLPNSGRIILISSEEMDEESAEAVALDEEEGCRSTRLKAGSVSLDGGIHWHGPLDCRAEHPSRCPPPQKAFSQFQRRLDGVSSVAQEVVSFRSDEGKVGSSESFLKVSTLRFWRSSRAWSQRRAVELSCLYF